MANENKTAKPSGDKAMAGIMERNIKELAKLRQNDEKEKSHDEHIADKITGFTGSMSFVYIHLIIFAMYIAWNAGMTAIKPIDPSFTGLSTIASVEAIFLSTFVLIRQNRMNKLADKRANLDLQVSLLAEHEITKLLSLVSAIAHKLDIEEAKNPEFDELARQVTPEKVLETIEKHTQESFNKTGIQY